MDGGAQTSGCFVKNPPRAPVSCSALAHSVRAEDGGAARAAQDALTRHQSSFCGVQLIRILATALKAGI